MLVTHKETVDVLVIITEVVISIIHSETVNAHVGYGQTKPQLSVYNPSRLFFLKRVSLAIVPLNHQRKMFVKNIQSTTLIMHLWMKTFCSQIKYMAFFKMTPLERLHTTSEGLTKYMIDSLRNTIGDLGDGKKLMTKIENLHHTLHFDLKRNSERDIPRGSARNGALKNTLVSTTERRGNMFRVLCLCHTAAIRDDLQTILIQSSIIPAKFFKCLKLYISMEEWFNDNNPKREVWSAQRLVSKTLELIHHAFP